MSIELAKSLVKKGSLTAAKDLLLEMDSMNQSTAESHYLLGTIHHRGNELLEAVNCFKRALLLDPSFTDAAISLSIVYNDTGHYQEGKKNFEQAEKSLAARSSTSPTTSVMLTRDIAKRHMELGDLYRQLQKLDEAANEYLKVSRLEPNNLEARILLAKTHGQRGQYKLACEELEKLVKEYPDYVSARVHLALLYYALGKTVDAQIELQEALMKEPDNQQVKMYLGLTNRATESVL